MKTLGEVYEILVEKGKEDPDHKQAWVDDESNTIWVIGDQYTLIRFQSDKILKDMTEKEIHDLAAFMLAMDED